VDAGIALGVVAELSEINVKVVETHDVSLTTRAPRALPDDFSSPDDALGCPGTCCGA
jgi:hypothetical protein